MRTLSRITCAVLVGTALFGVVGLSSTATAAPARPLGTTATVIGDEVSTSATRAFWIENRTSEGMTVYGLKPEPVTFCCPRTPSPRTGSSGQGRPCESR